MSAHTPGPWLVSNDGYNYIVGTARGVDEIADLIDSEADARLIHAAPDLLSIAKRWAAIDGGAWNVQRHAQEKKELLADTRAAIAKAEGREP